MQYEPQLATLVKTPPSGDRWVHEIKYDGYRIGCLIQHGSVSLVSRNGKDWTTAFPEIAAAARELPVAEALIDGEVAVVLPDGRTSFQAMQRRGTGRGALVYFVFDLLSLDGERVARRPLAERKARLRALVGGRADARIRYADHVVGHGKQVLEQSCRLGLEGVVSKRIDLPHVPGRTDAWQKAKCTRRQEFVVGGFTDPQGARAGLGALLIGYYDDGGTLVFAGRVGTGFTQQGATDLRTELDGLSRKTCPFSPPPAGPLARTAHWVRPELVCEVAFTEWTDDSQLRHPSFQGLRRDKPAREVTRE